MTTNKIGLLKKTSKLIKQIIYKCFKLKNCNVQKDQMIQWWDFAGFLTSKFYNSIKGMSVYYITFFLKLYLHSYFIFTL